MKTSEKGSWKEYVQYHIKEDDPELDIDSLREEEKSLYENGYISTMELYFGEVKTEEEI